MIRWKYVVPRLALFVMVVGLLSLATNPALRWAIVSTGQSVTGAKVEVDRVASSLLSMNVSLRGFQAADPNRPMKNLFEADHIKLDLDPAALARRKVVVTRAHAIGLRLGTDRSTSGAVSPSQQAEFEKTLSRQFADFGQAWLDKAVDRLQEDVEGNLQSVQLSRELMARWPAEYDRLEADAKAVKSRVDTLRELISDSGENPLRNLASYQEAISNIESLHASIFEVRGNLQRLQQQVAMDKEKIVAAKEHDEQFIREQLQLENLDSKQLSEYLLGPELGSRLAIVLEWLRWGRKHVPSARTDSLAKRGRGEDIIFPGIRPTPTAVIETFVLRGESQFGGQPMHLEGIIKGLNSNSKLYDKPTEVAIQTTGGMPMLIQAVLDNSGDTDHDQVVVNCPQMPQPERVLGNPEKLAVTVSPGNTHMWLSVDLLGDQLSGELVIKQEQVQLTPTLAPRYDTARISQLVSTALDGVDSVEAAIQLAGTLDEPRWKLESNLGPALAQGVKQAFSSHLVEYRQELLQRAHQEVDANLREFETKLLAKQQELLQKLDIGQDEVAQIKQAIASRVDLTDRVLSKNSPLREIFRR